jgi:hypothetical protein
MLKRKYSINRLIQLHLNNRTRGSDPLVATGRKYDCIYLATKTEIIEEYCIKHLTRMYSIVIFVTNEDKV